MTDALLKGGPGEAIRYFKRVLAVARAVGDDELLAIPSSMLGQALIIQGNCRQAGPLLAQAIEPLVRIE